MLRLRDRLLPLVTLAELLRAGAATHRAEAGQCIVVTAVGAGMLGIIVDDVFDTEEIVVKPVAPILRHVTMFSGNTILGDGSVIMILDPNGIARASGIAAQQPRHAESAAGAGVAQSERAHGHAAVPRRRRLAARRCRSAWWRGWRTSSATRSKSPPAQPVTQYRGRLMPLVPLSRRARHDQGTTGGAGVRRCGPRLGRDRCMGLMVDEIVDVVEDRLSIELSGDRPGLLGTAVMAGRATDVIDTAYWLTQAAQDWFGGGAAIRRGAGAALLVVEDSDFFRKLLVPALAAAGYEVTACETAARGVAPARDGGDVRRHGVGHRNAGDGRAGFRAHAARRRRLGRAAGDRAERPGRRRRNGGRPRRRLHRLRGASSTATALLASLRQCLADTVPAAA